MLWVTLDAGNTWLICSGLVAVDARLDLLSLVAPSAQNGEGREQIPTLCRKLRANLSFVRLRDGVLQKPRPDLPLQPNCKNVSRHFEFDVEVIEILASVKRYPDYEQWPVIAVVVVECRQKRAIGRTIRMRRPDEWRVTGDVFGRRVACYLCRSFRRMVFLRLFLHRDPRVCVPDPFDLATDFFGKFRARLSRHPLRDAPSR